MANKKENKNKFKIGGLIAFGAVVGLCGLAYNAIKDADIIIIDFNK